MWIKMAVVIHQRWISLHELACKVKLRLRLGMAVKPHWMP